MAVVTQPIGMVSSNGVVLTVGIRANGDRCAIVIPLATDSPSLDAKSLCYQAVQDFDGLVADILCGALSENAYISFLQAEGMDDGKIPFRMDYSPTDQPGTEDGPCETSQVAGLIVFYADPEDVPGGGRMRVAKNFIPGVPDADIVGDAVSSNLGTALDAIAVVLAEGYVVGSGSTAKWYRVIAAPPSGSSGVGLIRVGVWVTRGYTGTQRRRLIPH